MRAQGPFLFLFGSVESLLNSQNRLFEKLDRLRFHIYINVGLESIDPSTLKFLGKPVSQSSVLEAFQKMLDINASFENIEVTANFVLGEGLSETHYQSLKDLLRNAPVVSGGKGGIYLSPLKDNPKRRELLPLIKGIKTIAKFRFSST